MRSRAATAALGIFLAALAVALWLAPGRGTWIIDPDAAAYVGLARSLAAGDGYTFAGVPHAKFPPGFPAWLSIAVAATGSPDCYGAMRDLVALAGLVSVLLCFLVGRRLFALSPWASFLLAFAFGTSIYLLQYSVSFLRSETLFTAVLFGALLAGDAWRQRGGFGRAAGSGLLAGASLMVRSAGVAALVAIAVARLVSIRPFRIERSPRALLECALYAAIALLPSFAFSAYIRGIDPQHRTSSSYGDELLAAYALDLTKDVDVDMPRIGLFSGEMADRVRGNLGVLALSLGKFLVNDNKGANLATDSQTGAMHAGGLALLIALALGLAVAWRRSLVMIGIAVPAYLLLYLIWPFNQQQRFYLPIAPILLVLMMAGARPLLRLALAAAARPAGRLALAAGAVAVAVALLLGRSDAPRYFGRWSASYLALVALALAAALGLVLAAAILRGRRTDAAASERVERALALGAMGLFFALSAAGSVRLFRSIADDQREYERLLAERPVMREFPGIKTNPDLLDLTAVLKREAKPGDLVMSDIPKILHLLTGLRTTPLRYSSRDSTLRLDTPDGRARFVYYSYEIPQANAVFRSVLAREPDLLAPVHAIAYREGTETFDVCLYRVKDRP